MCLLASPRFSWIACVVCAPNRTAPSAPSNWGFLLEKNMTKMGIQELNNRQETIDQAKSGICSEAPKTRVVLSRCQRGNGERWRRCHRRLQGSKRG